MLRVTFAERGGRGHIQRNISPKVSVSSCVTFGLNGEGGVIDSNVTRNIIYGRPLIVLFSVKNKCSYSRFWGQKHLDWEMNRLSMSNNRRFLGFRLRYIHRVESGGQKSINQWFWWSKTLERGESPKII